MLKWWNEFKKLLIVRKDYLGVGQMHVPWHGFFISLLMIGTVVTASVYTSFDFNSSDAAVARTFKVTATCFDDPLVFSPLGDIEVRLSWSAVTNARYYNVRRIVTGPGNRWQTIAQNINPSASPSFSDTNVSRDMRYVYQVRAQGKNRFRLSNVVVITTDLKTCNSDAVVTTPSATPTISPRPGRIIQPPLPKTSCNPQPPCPKGFNCPDIVNLCPEIL